jgi:hypothetical protein
MFADLLQRATERPRGDGYRVIGKRDVKYYIADMAFVAIS